MRPTYLYVKRHLVSGVRYFGKTISDPLRYKGSGLIWKRHLKKHGEFVRTEWTMLFENEEEIRDFALAFSEVFDIVNSEEWANLIPEDGIGGYPKGQQHPPALKAKRLPMTEEHKSKISAARRAQRSKHTEETKRKMSESHKRRRACVISEILPETNKMVEERSGKGEVKNSTC